MERAEKIREKALEIVENGEKPSATRLSRELSLHESDIHRCLNALERNGEIETYTKELFGRKHRMIGICRE